MQKTGNCGVLGINDSSACTEFITVRGISPGIIGEGTIDGQAASRSSAGTTRGGRCPTRSARSTAASASPTMINTVNTTTRVPALQDHLHNSSKFHVKLTSFRTRARLGLPDPRRRVHRLGRDGADAVEVVQQHGPPADAAAGRATPTASTRAPTTSPTAASSPARRSAPATTRSPSRAATGSRTSSSRTCTSGPATACRSAARPTASTPRRAASTTGACRRSTQGPDHRRRFARRRPRGALRGLQRHPHQVRRPAAAVWSTRSPTTASACATW